MSQKCLLSTICKLITSSFNYLYHTIKCRKIDYFHYDKLALPNYQAPEGFKSVFLYGQYKAVAKLSGRRFNFLTDYLEHGVCFSDNPDSAPLMGYISRRGLKRVYTMGERRADVLRRYLNNNNLTADVASVGPYITGVPHFYSLEKLQALKNSLGRTLLIFPTHSIEKSAINRNVVKLCDEVDKIRAEYDTILCCVYWWDIISAKDEVNYYQERGYKVVTAGHRNDPKFLRRLKDIIWLSDIVVLDNIGTNLGYAITMNKPIFFAPSGNKLYCGNGDESQLSVQEELQQSVDNLNDRCAELFGHYPPMITKLQLDFVEEYWGSN